MNIKKKHSFILIFTFLLTVITFSPFLYSNSFRSNDLLIEASFSNYLNYQNLDNTNIPNSYKNLLKQKSSLSLQENSRLFTDNAKYKKATKDLYQLRYELTLDKDYGEIKNFQPPYYLVLKNMNDSKDENNINLQINKKSFSSLFLKLLSSSSLLWVIICISLSYNVLLNEKKHPSLTRISPKILSKRILNTFGTYLLCLIYYFSCLLFFSFISSVFKNTKNSFHSFDNSIYLGNYCNINEWKISVMLIGFMIGLFIFFFLLFTLVGFYIKNSLINGILGLILYYCSYLFFLVPNNVFSLFGVFNPYYLLEGRYSFLSTTYPSIMNFKVGIVMILVSNLILFFILIYNIKFKEYKLYS